MAETKRVRRVLVLFGCSEIQMKSNKNGMVTGSYTNADYRAVPINSYILRKVRGFG